MVCYYFRYNCGDYLKKIIHFVTMSPENHILVNNDCDFGHLIASASGGNEDHYQDCFVLRRCLIPGQERGQEIDG
jgi:hypothetical protein